MNMVKQFSIVLMAVFALSNVAIAGKKEVPPTVEGTTKVTAEQIFDLLDKYPDLVMIDSRKPSDRAKGYIEGSIGLPDTETNAESLAKHVPSKATPILFYCNGIKCGRSVKAAKKAVEYGYTNIYWFRGGWEEWLDKGYPIVK